MTDAIPPEQFGSLVDDQRPWLGLKSFSESHAAYFFGRDKETLELFRRVRDNPLTILFAKSGRGKSSLIGSGLLPKLKIEGYEPTLLRLGHDKNSASPIEQTFRSINKVLFDVNDMVGSVTNLWEFFHLEISRRPIAERRLVLILDQFEEIFSLPRNEKRLEANQFLRQLADLAENRVPAEIAGHIRQDRSLMAKYNFSDVSLRILISMREDYLSQFEAWKPVMPSMMRNRMQIGLLNGPQALEAVVRPGQRSTDPIITDQIGERIVRIVSKAKEGTPLAQIHSVPPLLSLFCYRLNEDRIEQGRSQISNELIDATEDRVIPDFYRSVLRNSPSPNAVQKFVEDNLLTASKHRIGLPREEAENELQKLSAEEPSACIDHLLDARLITAEERDGVVRVEIVHDMLIPTIVSSRTQRREAVKQAMAPEQQEPLTVSAVWNHDPDATLAPPDYASASSTNLAPGGSIGPFKLLELLGRGGMGEVWEAEQKQPIARRVAIKVVRAGIDSENALSRFEAERQAIGMMNHPNIARVLDAGTTVTGHPYIAMELVRGIPIDRYCDQHRLAISDRLHIFLKVCDALQHAHAKGILHRDIKASNILVAEEDGSPVPKIIDFGLAKMLAEDDVQEITAITQVGQVIGTLTYMSPEQAANHSDIDTRADIYSLGVILFRLLTGEFPIDVRNISMLQSIRMIMEVEPAPPSQKILDATRLPPKVCDDRQTTPSKLRLELRGDLDWITMKALAKERERRYQSASAFAEDIRRYQNSEAILARPASLAYQLVKFARRNRTLVRAGAMAIIMILTGFVSLTAALQWALDRRDTASDATLEAFKLELLGNQDAALRKYKEALSDFESGPLARSQSSDALVQRIELQNNLADAQVRVSSQPGNEVDQAIATYQKSLQLAETLVSNNELPEAAFELKALTLFKLAKAWQASGDSTKSQGYYEQCKQLLEGRNDLESELLRWTRDNLP